MPTVSVVEIVVKLCLSGIDDSAGDGGVVVLHLLGRDRISVVVVNPYLREPKAKNSTVLHFCKFPWENRACRMFKC